MIIPDKLKIGGHWIDIKYAEKLDDNADGEFDSETATITLKASLSQSHKEATLFHEIFHGLNSVIDHTLLDSLAEQFYQVLSDNHMLK